MSRIFVALQLSERLQNTIQDWRQDYTNLPIRWLANNNLHLTLIPPWDEQRPDEVASKLQTLANQFGAFDITLHEVGFGPDPKEPRLIWATGTTLVELLATKQAAEGILDKPSLKKTFLTHVTLARLSPISHCMLTLEPLPVLLNNTSKLASFIRNGLRLITKLERS